MESTEGVDEGDDVMFGVIDPVEIGVGKVMVTPLVVPLVVAVLLEVLVGPVAVLLKVLVGPVVAVLLEVPVGPVVEVNERMVVVVVVDRGGGCVCVVDERLELRHRRRRCGEACEP